MGFPCPYCRHSITVKSPKPGSYQPKCPKCSRVFQLTVPQAGEPVAASLADEGVVRKVDDTVRMPQAPVRKPPPE